MLHIKFKAIGPLTGSREGEFKGFYHEQAWRPGWSYERSREGEFKGFYHEQAWRPGWSNELDCLFTLLFPQSKEALCETVTIDQVAFETLYEIVILWES